MTNPVTIDRRNAWIPVALLAAGTTAWVASLRLSHFFPSHPAAFIGIWTLMMLAMMAPSVLPAVLVFVTSSPPPARAIPVYTPVFVTGYLLSWAGLGAVVALGRVVAGSVMTWGRPAVAIALVLAGLYQLTRWKRLCLTHCRSPFQFFLQHWRPGAIGALLMGESPLPG